MTRIVVVGDTHVRRWEDIHPALALAVAEADIAIHCGDWVSHAVVEGFRRHARRAIVVHGNSDPPELRAVLPYREVVDVEGVRIGVTHPAWAGPEPPPAQLLPDFPLAQCGPLDIICYGHTHEPLDETVEADGHGRVRFVNPGQGYPSFMVPGTLATIDIEAGAVEVRIVEFAPAR